MTSDTAIVSWLEVQERLPLDAPSKQFADTALILGNGASVSISERFNYSELLEESSLGGHIMEAIRSNCEVNFEEALRVLAVATKLLGVDATSDLAATYAEIQRALIAAVRAVHPPQYEVRDRLLEAVRILRWFPTIVTLNYDLLLYWTMMLDPGRHRGNWFKDGFTDGHTFTADWPKLHVPHRRRPGATLVFYAHGNLSLVDYVPFAEYKISVRDQDEDMLEAVLRTWKREHRHPLFVSEGLPEFKRHRIESSSYLSKVYREVLGRMPSNVVVYGWSVQEQDEHLLERILSNSPKFLAISSFRGQPESKQLTECIERAAARPGVEKPEVVLYDAEAAWKPSAPLRPRHF